ncbi:helix-turn-helix transcriptional regulator [Micromonospora sonneratiae]|uniref:Helix-turn-helix domain-containing protein n=1 Tax=Micromonospora sonneratiae TaxID=1184706 RepID=A0ABW3Y9T3_9ACTN
MAAFNGWKREPDASAPTLWAEFGRRLRGWRRRAGLTQAQVARQVGYDHTVISKLESGRREPPSRLVRRLDELLQTGGELLAACTETPGQYLPPEVAASRSDGIRLTPLPGDGQNHRTDLPIVSITNWPRSLPSHGLDCPLHGTLGCSVPAVGDALLTYQAMSGADPTAQLSPHADPDTIHVLTALLAVYNRAGVEQVSVGLTAAVEHALHGMTRWLEVLTGRPRRAVLRLAASYAELAGELRLQQGQNGLAMAWFTMGLRWAVETDDIGMRVALLCDMSTLARLEHDAASTLGYARALRSVDADRTWVAMLADIYEARGHALTGDAAQVRHHIDSARKLSEHLGPRDDAEAPWLFGSAGQVYVETGASAALRDIAARTADRATARLAVAAVERSLDRLPEFMHPARVLFTLRLADGYACAGEPQAALTVAEPVLTAAVTQPTAIISQELRGLQSRLAAGWGDQPDVRAFLRNLNAGPA